MTHINRFLKRISYITAATVVSLSSLLALMPQGASAAQVTARSIKMSNSATTASNATTTYTVTFNAGSSYTIRGIIVDFCANSPIIGDTTCTATVGTNVPSLAASTVTNSGTMASAGSWTTTKLNANRTLDYENTTGVAVTSASTLTFDILTTQNPTTVGTFYARIYTYTTTTGSAGYTVANPDVVTVHSDDGGVALSTANQLTITAKVQETLLFCVYTTGSACSGSSIAGIPLGDTFGVLSVYNAAYVAATLAKVGLASNATSGVTVRAKGATLTSGSNTIAATGSGSGTCTADATATSTEQYGFRISAVGASQAAVGYGSGSGCTAGIHAFNTTNLASTYGDSILTTAGPQDESASSLEFAAKAATTTKPGVYTSTMTFIATGIY